MAKGVGWMMAEVMGSLKVAHLVGQVVICPVCGEPMTVGGFVESFKCQAESREADMPSWLEKALKAQGFSPWAYYAQDGAISVLATAGNGAELQPLRGRGRFGGWQWSKKPDGAISFPDWFPIAERDQYVASRFEAWWKELSSMKDDPDLWWIALEEKLQQEHPVLLLRRAKAQVEQRAREKEALAKQEAERQADQAEVDKALATAGFFDGRLGKATLPEGVTIIRRESMGSRRDPYYLVAAPKLTLAQLRALVQARGDYSEVVEEGGTVSIVTPNPGQWIGRGGSTIKALGRALGRYVKVVEKR